MALSQTDILKLKAKGYVYQDGRWMLDSRAAALKAKEQAAKSTAQKIKEAQAAHKKMIQSRNGDMAYDAARAFAQAKAAQQAKAANPTIGSAEGRAQAQRTIQSLTKTGNAKPAGTVGETHRSPMTPAPQPAPQPAQAAVLPNFNTGYTPTAPNFNLGNTPTAPNFQLPNFNTGNNAVQQPSFQMPSFNLPTFDNTGVGQGTNTPAQPYTPPAFNMPSFNLGNIQQGGVTAGPTFDFGFNTQPVQAPTNPIDPGTMQLYGGAQLNPLIQMARGGLVQRPARAARAPAKKTAKATVSTAARPRSAGSKVKPATKRAVAPTKRVKR